MFELVAIAIFGPMILALLGAQVYVASCEALTRLRVSSFLNSPHDFLEVGTVHRATLA